MQCATKLLDNLGTQEEALLTFNASNMILAVYSNASYLSKPKACLGPQVPAPQNLLAGLTPCTLLYQLPGY